MAENEYISLKIPVPNEYKDVFSHFYFAENKSSELIYKTFLPSYQTILIFNFGESAMLHSKNSMEMAVERCLVLGPIRQAFDYSLPPSSKILVANFKGDAFYRFFGNACVAEHLSINPDDLLEENCFAALWAELDRIGNIDDQVNYLLDFSKPYLKDKDAIAEKLIDLADENFNPVKYLASQQNQTERNIQLKHKKILGYTSKEISRYKRFLKAIDLIQNNALSSTKVDWFEIINECGYYDQSQLIHDFRHYLNISPTKYLKFQQDICMTKTP